MKHKKQRRRSLRRKRKKRAEAADTQADATASKRNVQEHKTRKGQADA